jgi:monofunctional biosynthetic peptidoglycan transglycosylase
MARARWRRSWRTWFLLAVIGLGGLIIGGPIWWLSEPEGIGAFEQGAPRTWSKLEAEQALRGKHAIAHSWVNLSDVSVDVQLAVVSGEDAGFLFHNGIEINEMRAALHDWWEEGEELRGASTITQQLAKNLFLSEERSLWRKLREARYAWWMERRLGKRRILELYLNIVELAPGVLGIQAGAKHYYGVGASELSATQGAELAAAIPSPLKHNPETRTRPWQIRYDAIRERMAVFDNVRHRLAALKSR